MKPKLRGLPDYTQQEAWNEALRRWPEKAIVKYNTKTGVCIVGTATGNSDEINVYGSALTWREAFAQADIVAPKHSGDFLEELKSM